MKKIFLSIAVLATLAVACNTVENNITPNEPEAGVGMITETVSGSSAATKATIDASAKFAWTVGDNIAVHISNGKYVYTSDDGASGASAAANSASFTVAYPDGYARDAFALFPSTIVDKSAANYGQTGQALDVTLPASYTLAEASGTTSPCPMIATNTPGSGWSFHQLCGMLRLTVFNIPPSTKRLEFDFDGQKVSGSFSIASPVTPGTSVIATTADGANDVIAIVKGDGETLNNNKWLDKLVLNIPLPAGTYTNITATAYDAVDAGNAVLSKAISFAYTATNKYATKDTVVFPVFSVGADKRVVFAPGNLQATYDATAKTWDWHFAANQYDRIGNGGGNKIISTLKKEDSDPYAVLSADGTVDLFSRSTSETYYGIARSTTSSYFTGAFKDWGELSIRKNATPPYTYYPANYWYTLPEAEWQYVVGEGTYRENGGAITWSVGSSTYSALNALCTKATVNGVCGFILFPDHYNGGMPSGVTWDIDFISSGNMGHSGTDGWGATVTAAGWAALEDEGCVFLPVGGFRIFYNDTYNVVANTTTGYYMSTSNTVLRFNDDGFDPNQGLSSYEYSGRSVRLAHEVK